MLLKSLGAATREDEREQVAWNASYGGGLPGNEIQSPMAKVILGGLLSSTLLNGFVIPVMYIITKKN